jgi:CRISPR/Cas system-associated endonuclease Cas1
MEIFRATRVGAALIESLNQLIDSGDITSDVANEVLQNYEQIFLKNYEDEISKKLLPVITIQV